MLQHANSTSSLVVNFTQERHMSILQAPAMTNGKMTTVNPGMLRWETFDPSPYTLVLKRDKVQVKENGKITSSNIASSRIEHKMFATIRELVEGNLSKHFAFTASYSENETGYKITLTPKIKRLANYLLNIEVVLQKDNLLVQQCSINEVSGDYTLIRFTDHMINTPVSQEEFVLN